MPNPEQSCRSCRWWSAPPWPSVFGQCEWEIPTLPDWITESLPAAVMGPSEGWACPTWEQRS